MHYGKRLLILATIFSSSIFAQEGNFLENEIKELTSEYHQLVTKEQEKRESLMNEKKNLETEILQLEEQVNKRDEIIKKLEMDSQIRWHRDQYKKLLKNYKVYLDKIDNIIAEKKQHLTEIDNILNHVE